MVIITIFQECWKFRLFLLRRAWCPLNMDTSSQGHGFRDVLETCVACLEGWLWCTVGHCRAGWVWDETLSSPRTSSRADWRKEGPGSSCDHSSLENTWYPQQRCLNTLTLWARTQPTGNLQMQSYFRIQERMSDSSVLQIRASLQVVHFQPWALLLFLKFSCGYRF